MCITCPRSSPIAPAPLLERFFVFLLSSFLFSRPSAHFCLNDFSKTPTNFCWGFLISLTAYFFAVIFCLRVDPYFLFFTTPRVRNCAQNISSSIVLILLSIRSCAIAATRPTDPTM